MSSVNMISSNYDNYIPSGKSAENVDKTAENVDKSAGNVTFYQKVSLAENAVKGAGLGAAFAAGGVLSDGLRWMKGLEALGAKDTFNASEKLAGHAIVKGSKIAVPVKLAENISYDSVKDGIEATLLQIKKQAPKRIAKGAAIGAAIFGGLAVAGKMILSHAKKTALNNIKQDVEEHTGKEVEITRDKKNKNQYNINFVK